MTRTFVVGASDDETGEMLRVVTEAQAAGVAAVRPGVSGEHVDSVARAVIEDAGLGAEFVHGVGHGVGLLIHENPFLKGSEVELAEGQVVTVEPGVYRSGFGGVRVEDTVVVTPSGCRPLTHSPKDPVVA
jgi:Xaa-Pro aminopeptidase